MVLLLIQLIEKIIEEVGLVPVLDRAESETLEERYVVDVVLNRPPCNRRLDSFPCRSSEK